METAERGRVTVEATIENIGDLWDQQKHPEAGRAVRTVVVPNALVDSGATLLSVPTRFIRALGLYKTGEKHIVSSKVATTADMYSAVRLTIMGRECTMDVVELPDEVPVLIGQIPLVHLDFVIDMRNQKLIGNPAHGGEHVYEMY